MRKALTASSSHEPRDSILGLTFRGTFRDKRRVHVRTTLTTEIVCHESQAVKPRRVRDSGFAGGALQDGERASVVVRGRR
jgi:hypothetical protein